MFDTSVVRARAIAAPRGVTLAISIAVHSIAVVAAVALTVTSTRLPPDPPRQLELYRPVEVPSVPPGPLGVRQQPKQAVAAPRKTQPAVTPALPVAPQTIPDQVPAVPESTGTAAPEGTGDPTDTAGPIGDPYGTPGGIDLGVPGGTGAPHPGPYTPGVAGVTAARVLTRVEPRFPQSLIGGVRSATVVVNCVIGKDGRIHDPQIIVSSFAPFNESVLEALRRWTFAPGTRNGQPVDTYFQLTVNFEVRR